VAFSQKRDIKKLILRKRDNKKKQNLANFTRCSQKSEDATTLQRILHVLTCNACEKVHHYYFGPYKGYSVHDVLGS